MRKITIALIFLCISSLIFKNTGLAQTEAVKQDRTDAVTLTEQKVYVPYEKLNDVLGKNEKGIFIPYSDFLKLWEAATRKPPEKKTPEPPVDAAIVHAHYSGTVQDDMARFHGELKISVLKDKWAELFLDLDKIALTSVSLNREPPLIETAQGGLEQVIPEKEKWAKLFPGSDKITPTSVSLNDKPPLFEAVKGGLELVIPEKGEYLLKIDFMTQVESRPGRKNVAFKLPSAPLTKIDLTIPGTDLDVRIEPRLSQNSTVADGLTKFSAFLPPSGDVNVQWLVQAEEKTIKPLIFADVFSEADIRESVYTIRTDIDFTIMQAKTDSFSILIPESLDLVRVEGQNIKEWDMQNRTLSVSLFEKIDGPYRLKIETEQFRKPDDKTFAFPAIQIPDAKREQGMIAVLAASSLRVKVKRSAHTSRIDFSEIPKAKAGKNYAAAYRYFRHPFDLVLDVSMIEPRVFAQQKKRIAFTENLIDFTSDISYDIKDAGVFRLSFQMPDKFRVIQVGESKSVDSYSVTREKDANILRVVLKNKAFGKFKLPVHLEADMADFAKESSGYAISLKDFEFTCLDVQKEDGIIAIALRNNLKLSTSDIKGLRPVSLEELRRTGFKPSDSRSTLVAGYRYAAVNYDGNLDIQKRKTRVIASVERTVSIAETSVKTSDMIRFKILYAPVRSFRIEVPVSLGKEAQIYGENIKEKRFIKEKTDDEAETGIWEIELHSPRSGRYHLRLNLDTPIPEIKTGAKKEIEIPIIKVLNIFNETGYVAISTSPSLEVASQAANLEPIDARELPASMNRAGATLAFKYFSHPYSLALNCTRHDYEKVLSTVITQAHFDIILSQEGVAKTEAVFRVRNTNRQSIEILMPDGTQNIYSVLIAGRKASLSKGTSATSKILMLPKDIPPGKEFTVRMIYQSQVTSPFSFLGQFQEKCAEIKEIPTLKMTWRLYLPTAWSYLYMTGSMQPVVYQRGFFQNINTRIYSQNIHYQGQIKTNNQKILRQNDEQTPAGLDVSLVREGKLYQFSKLDKNADLIVIYLKKNILYPSGIILFLIALVGAAFICRKTRSNRLTFILGALGCTYLFTVFIPQGFKFFVWVVFWGIAACGAIFLINYVISTRRKRAKTDTGGEDSREER
ncbi:hypothetical protein QUF75_17560 [Desulfococcaceae bacterium HSG7]|nr:hypothetical protein [Desulfococcaceae bacterium HSG7]